MDAPLVWCSLCCRYLAPQGGVTLQLHADNLKCTTTQDRTLLRAVRFTAGTYIQAVGLSKKMSSSARPKRLASA